MQPHDLFSDLEPPTPPGGLRERTLAAAETALSSTPEPDTWTRVWSSLTMRVAWAACIICLIAGHLLISVDVSGPHGITMVQADAELDDIATLPPIRFDIVPLSAVFAAHSQETATPMEDSSS